MDERILKCLYDIDIAINEIYGFLNNKPLDFNVYSENVLLKRGIERNLEIIGEAVARIRRKDEHFEISNAKRIIGLRNQIIHAYDNISDENIWSIVINHLPELKKEIDKLINENL